MIVGPIWSDGAGTLLVAELGKRPAGHPIWRYQGGVSEPIPLPTTRASLVYGLAMQRARDLWVATSAGLWRYDGAIWERTRVSRRATRAGLPGEAHGPLWVDALDRVWASTDAGVAAYADGAWRRVAITLVGDPGEAAPEPWELAQVSAFATHLDAQGRLWLGHASGEIGYIDTAQPLRER